MFMELTPVDLPGDQKLCLAAQNLVDAKDELDDLIGRPAVQALVPSYLTTSHGRAVDGWTFARAVVPFLELGSGSRRFPGRVPLLNVIGEPWREPRSELYDSEEHRAGLADYLSSDERSARDDPDPAEVVWIQALALGVAREGRNRVPFLRRMAHADMPARVESIDYPARDRLAVYGVPAPGQPVYWCLKDKRWLQPLPLPSFTLPLLAAYGVPGPLAWPEDWVKPDVVREAIEHHGSDPAWRIRIDLPALVKVEQAKQAYDVFVPAAPLDLAGIQFNWRMGTSVLAGWLGAMLVGLVLPSEWRMAVHAGASGGLIGIAAGLTGHFIFARRRHLARFEPEG